MDISKYFKYGSVKGMIKKGMNLYLPADLNVFSNAYL